MPVQPKIAGAQILEVTSFIQLVGNYLAQQNGWIFHEDLGWCFSLSKRKIIGFGWKITVGLGQRLQFGHTCTETVQQVGSIY